VLIREVAPVENVARTSLSVWVKSTVMFPMLKTMIKSCVPPAAGIRLPTALAVKVTEVVLNAERVHPAGAAVVFEKSVLVHGAVPHVAVVLRIRNLTAVTVSPAVLVFLTWKAMDDMVLILKIAAAGTGLVWVTV
jgi:fructose-specific phosphotransferase system IIC component